jgi:hypothetical protein
MFRVRVRVIQIFKTMFKIFKNNVTPEQFCLNQIIKLILKINQTIKINKKKN